MSLRARKLAATSPLAARGMCINHYNQWNYWRVKRGEPMPPAAERRRAVCTIDGCDNFVQGHGYCPKHYARWRANGDPLVSKINRVPMDERFLLSVDKRGPDECWPYAGYINKRGYGQFSIRRNRLTMAHRMAYRLAGNELPASLQIDHLCHRPEECDLADDCPHRRCCNPAHLAPATNRDNTLRGGGPTAVNAAKTHCINDHEFTPENTRICKDGGRSCIECERQRRTAHKGKAA